MTRSIPDGILPVPRLIIWHAETESSRGLRALDVLQRKYQESIGRDGIRTGKTSGGSDWSGWHLPDPDAVARMAKAARSIGPKHWTILEELGWVT